MDSLDLTDFFTTRSQATDFSDRLSIISDLIYQTDFDLDRELTNQFGLAKKDKFMLILKDHDIRPETGSPLQEFLKHVVDQIATLPTVSLTLALAPNDIIAKAVSGWFVQNLKTQILLDVTVDPDMLGGAIVNFQGKHADFSVKPAFDRIVEEALHTPEINGHAV